MRHFVSATSQGSLFLHKISSSTNVIKSVGAKLITSNQGSLVGHDGAITGMETFGEKLVTVGVDRALRVWDLRRWRGSCSVLVPDAHNEKINCILHDERKGHFYTGGEDGYLRTFSTDGKLIGNNHVNGNWMNPIRCMFRFNEYSICGGLSNGKIIFQDSRFFCRLDPVKVSNFPIQDMKLLEENNFVASFGDRSMSVFRYDEANNGLSDEGKRITRMQGSRGWGQVKNMTVVRERMSEKWLRERKYCVEDEEERRNDVVRSYEDHIFINQEKKVYFLPGL